jgi:hypothetical protein
MPDWLTDQNVFGGHIGRQPLQDRVFIHSCSPTAGPFPDVKSFHDWFSELSARHAPGSRSPHPMRAGLPDNMSIKFTHSDLHRSNILITPSDERGPARVLALIDFEQSGWYPEYWEYCKALWTAKIGEEWETYLPRILDRHDDAFYYFDYFCLAIGV